MTMADFTMALATAQGLPAGTPPQELLAKLKERISAEPDPTKYMPVEAAQSMIADRLQERLALSEERADAKVTKAVKEGYITPAMQDWAVALCRRDEAAFDEYVQKTGPVFAYLLKTSHTANLPPDAHSVATADSDLESAVCNQLGLKPGSLKS